MVTGEASEDELEREFRIDPKAGLQFLELFFRRNIFGKVASTSSRSTQGIRLDSRASQRPRRSGSTHWRAMWVVAGIMPCPTGFELNWAEVLCRKVPVQLGHRP